MPLMLMHRIHKKYRIVVNTIFKLFYFPLILNGTELNTICKFLMHLRHFDLSLTDIVYM